MIYLYIHYILIRIKIKQILLYTLYRTFFPTYDIIQNNFKKQKNFKHQNVNF